MTWVLLNRKEAGTPTILRRYKDRRGALIGMRASNRNAGWTRTTRAHSAHTEMEWGMEFCARSNGLPVYDYGPYVIMNESVYEQKYRLNDLVEVKNLMSGQTVMIPRKDKGTCVDPSTERYWSM